MASLRPGSTVTMAGTHPTPWRDLLHARAIPAGIGALLAFAGGPGIPRALAFPPYPGSAPIKTASPAEVAPGAEIIWTIDVRNDFGNGDLAVSIVDDVPDPADSLPVQNFDIGTLTAPATAVSSHDGDILTVSNVFVPPGQTVSISFRTRVRSNAPDTVSLCNQATLHYVVQVCAPACNDLEFDTLTRPPGVSLAGPTCAVVRAPTTGPDLRDATESVAEEDGDAIGSPGELLTWTINVPNTGVATARNVVVSDVIDPAFVVVDPGGGTLSPGPPESLSWSLGDIAAGTSRTVAFTTRVACGVPEAPACNGATVTADTLTSQPTDDTATWALDDATCIMLASPSLELLKVVADEDGDGLYVPGDTLIWTVGVRNVGAATARQVTLGDLVPLGLAVTDPGGAVLVPGPPDLLTYPPSDVAPGRSFAWAFTTRLGDLTESTRVSNQATASSARLLACGTSVVSDDPSTAPVDATSIVVVRPTIGAFTKSVHDEDADGVAEPGELLTWDLSVENTGSAALVATLSDVLAEDLSLVDAGGASVVTGGVTTLTWALGVAANSTSQRTFTARVACDVGAGEALCNQAHCTGPLAGSRASDDPATPAPDDATCALVARPDLSTSTRTVRELVPDSLFLQGEEVLVMVRVENTGNVPATNVLVSDEIDPLLAISDPGSALVVPGPPVSLRWVVPALLPGTSVDLDYTARILATAADGAVARGQASAASAEDAACSITWITDDPSTPFPDDANVFTIGNFGSLDLLRESIVSLDPVTPALSTVLFAQCAGPTACQTCALTSTSASTVAFSGLPAAGSLLIDGDALNGTALMLYQLSGGGRCLGVSRADADGDGTRDDILLGW